MENQYILFALFVSLVGCVERWDDPIPEGAELGTPYLISTITEEGKVHLNWHFSRICPGFCPLTVDGSRYEVFGKFPGSSDFVRIARLGVDEKTFTVDNSEYGTPFEFYVTTHRAGQMTTSNRVMTVPNPLPAYETVVEMNNWDLLNHAKLNPQGTKLAFISNYLWTEEGQDFMTLSLFVHDILSRQTDLIQLNSNHPQWSADGQKIIFSSTQGLSQIAQGYTPSHLFTYDVESKEIKRLVESPHQHYFPSFGKGDNSVLFLSDSLERGELGLWKLDNEGNVQVLWPSFQVPEHGAGTSLTTGLYASPLKESVVLDLASVVENRAVFNIYAVEFGDGVQKKELVGSPWRDLSPAYSHVNENLLAFESDRSGTRQVWTLDTSSGKLNQVSYFQDNDHIGSNISLSWTDQGQSLVLPISGPTGIWKMVKISLIQ